MELALSLDEGLLEFLRLLEDPCRVFLCHLLDGCYHLLCICLVDGLDGTDIFGVRVLHEVEAVFAVLACKGVARAYVFQFDCAADVASYKFFNLCAVCACTCE